MANKTPNVYTGDKMMSLAKWLLDQQAPGAFNEEALTASLTKKGLKPERIAEQVAKQKALGDISDGVTLSQLGGLAGGAIQAHPIKSLALAGSAAGNIGGLFDDNKIGGQLGGAVLGGLAGNALGFNPAMSAMAGGNLGTLFDKLRTQKELEKQQAQQYMQGRR